MTTPNDFNLSDKIRKYNFPNDEDYINITWVKEFIKQLKDKMGNTTRGLNNKDLQIFYKEIDKIAGEDLI
jgi:hypothetical protein